MPTCTRCNIEVLGQIPIVMSPEGGATFRVCQSCLNDNECRCHYCRIRWTIGRRYRRAVCQRCYDEVAVCASCDTLLGHDDCSYGPDGDLCRDCADEEGSQAYSDCIMDYDYTPAYQYYDIVRGSVAVLSRPQPKTLYYGVELEMEFDGRDDYEWGRNGNKVQDTLRDLSLSDMFYLKRDGSIVCGCELVSHPLSWEYWQSIRPTIKTLLDRLSGFCASYKTSTCGMHVHVSDHTSTNQLYKLLRWFFENCRFVARISGRKDADDMLQWACFDYQGEIPNKAKSKTSLGKYEAIRVCPGGTLEFRIFKGTLNPKRFWRNLDFVHTIIEFCRSAKIRELTFKGYRKWINLNGKYPGLVDYLRELKPVPDTFWKGHRPEALDGWKRKKRTKKPKPKVILRGHPTIVYDDAGSSVPLPNPQPEYEDCNCNDCQETRDLQRRAGCSTLSEALSTLTEN